MAIRFTDEQPVKRKIRFTDEEPRVGGIPQGLPGAGVGSIPKSEFEAGERNVVGDIFERPAAASRAAIRANPKLAFAGPLAGVAGLTGLAGQKAKEASQAASLNPAAAGQTFQEEFIDKAQEPSITQKLAREGKISKELAPIAVGTEAFVRGIPASVGGLAADILTNPADALLQLVGLTAGKSAVGAISKTGVGKGLAKLGKADILKPMKKAAEALQKLNPLSKTNKFNQTIKNIKNPSKFAKNVRANLFKNKSEVGKTFGKELDKLSTVNPNRAVDLEQPFQLMKLQLDDVANNPGLKAEVKGMLRKVKNPQTKQMMNNLIDNPQGARKLTLKQAQDVKVAVQNNPSIARKLKQGKFADYTTGETEMLDLLDEIKLSQSESFPEISDIRKPYADFMNAYRNVKTNFGPKSLLQKIRSGFANEEIDDFVKVVLSDNVRKQMKSFKTTEKVLKGAAATAGAVGLAAAGGETARRFFVR